MFDAMLSRSSEPGVINNGISSICSVKVLEFIENQFEGQVACSGSLVLPVGNTNQIGAGAWYKLVVENKAIANVIVFSQMDQKFIFTGYKL